MGNESKNSETIRPEIPPDLDAVGTLLGLARTFLPSFELPSLVAQPYAKPAGSSGEKRFLKAEARYQVLLEQLPAVTFMAAFEEGLREIYVSPQIETLLGYTVREWTEEPILWYERLHWEDKDRWNMEFSRTVAWTERGSAPLACSKWREKPVHPSTSMSRSGNSTSGSRALIKASRVTSEWGLSSA